MTPRLPRLLLLNASLAGEQGNTAVLLARAKYMIAQRATVEIVTLGAGDGMTFEELRPQLESADGFLFGTGTHWDSWSSVLQRCLEEATPAEATALWLGKPAAVVVSEHSVGGKAVLSRLQGVLVTLGCLIPPMGGMVVSKAVRIAAAFDATAARDLWIDEDLAVVCDNLAEAARASQPGASPAQWKAWSVERDDISARWVETDTTGAIATESS